MKTENVNRNISLEPTRVLKTPTQKSCFWKTSCFQFRKKYYAEHTKRNLWQKEISKQCSKSKPR